MKMFAKISIMVKYVVSFSHFINYCITIEAKKSLEKMVTVTVGNPSSQITWIFFGLEKTTRKNWS